MNLHKLKINYIPSKNCYTIVKYLINQQWHYECYYNSLNRVDETVSYSLDGKEVYSSGSCPLSKNITQAVKYSKSPSSVDIEYCNYIWEADVYYIEEHTVIFENNVGMFNIMLSKTLQ
ncbi:MAG: hypothetical protein KDH96_09950 [Candidatus Riesia sp.]|nr:hypothetical protein [Candidatus Riesia sp.]